MDSKTSFSARIAIPGFNPKICKLIYDREMELRQLYPDLNFNFYFDGPELARAIKTDIEALSGRGYRGCEYRQPDALQREDRDTGVPV